MEFLLFLCDVIVLVVGVGLLYNIFDLVFYLGVCDKIVFGLIMVVVIFGYILFVFVFVGLMISGLLNDEKVCVWN